MKREGTAFMKPPKSVKRKRPVEGKFEALTAMISRLTGRKCSKIEVSEVFRWLLTSSSSPSDPAVSKKKKGVRKTRVTGQSRQ